MFSLASPEAQLPEVMAPKNRKERYDAEGYQKPSKRTHVAVWIFHNMKQIPKIRGSI